MSRTTMYQDARLTVAKGYDVAVGKFIQIFDNEMINETPEGEGLVLDWSEGFQFEVNYTGYPNTLGAEIIVNLYIIDCNSNANIISN
jgi:hypothetical protein